MLDIEIMIEQLREIPDFRKARGKRYLLHNLLTISILAILSGCDDFEAMALFCEKRADFLRHYGLLDGRNLPSHDLFRYIFMGIDKTAFSHLLSVWLDQIERPDVDNAALERQFIHIDGKILRATRSSEHTRTGLLVLNAYCSNTHVTIGGLLGDKKSSEKTLIPQLLENLDIRYGIVTIDAIGTMEKVAEIIADKKGDYLLALKKNNKHFFNEVDSFFTQLADTSLIQDKTQTIDKQGLRVDIRTCDIITDLRFFPDAQKWKNLKTLVRVVAQRTLNNKITTETRYYLTSLSGTAADLLAAVRRHWSIENELHWHLDVAFNEDKLRLREKNAVVCMAILRRFALAILKNSNDKNSIKHQRLAIAWSDKELDKVLNIIKL